MNKICRVCLKKPAGMHRTMCRSCRHLVNYYSLTDEQARVVLTVERCHLCDVKLDNDSPMCKKVVDHCHKSLEVRGVLCNSCNLIEGYLRDWDQMHKIEKGLIAYIKRGKMFGPQPKRSKLGWLKKLMTRRKRNG